MTEMTDLPFEYGRRWTELHEPMGVETDHAAYLEERDRQLEDYLAGLGAGGGKLPFFVAASDATAESKAMSDYVCTGTNDEVTIQAALDALAAYQANSGTPYFTPVSAPLLLSEGTFFVSSPILVSAVSAGGPATGPLRIVGRGSAQTFLQAVGTSKTVNCFQSVLSDSGAISAEGLCFHDFATALLGASDVSDGAAVRECRFDDCAAAATMTSASNFAVCDNELYDCTAGFTLTYCTNGVISGNRFHHTGNADITATELANAAIFGNESDTAGTHFLDLIDATINVTVSANMIEDTGATSIRALAGAANISALSVVGNVVSHGTSATAIYLAGASAAPIPVVVGNTLDGAATFDVDALVTANIITGAISGTGTLSGVQSDPTSVSMSAGGSTFYMDNGLMQIMLGTGATLELYGDSGYISDASGVNYAYVDASGTYVAAGPAALVDISGGTVSMFGKTGIDGTATPSTAAQLADVLVDLGVIASHTIP